MASSKKEKTHWDEILSAQETDGGPWREKKRSSVIFGGQTGKGKSLRNERGTGEGKDVGTLSTRGDWTRKPWGGCQRHEKKKSLTACG